MSKPIRVQRKRSKGWKMPENTVYVGRPTAWGNPYVGESNFNSILVVKLFREFIQRQDPHTIQFVERAKKHLKGKNLASWCPLDQPCHADVLLEIANAE